MTGGVASTARKGARGQGRGQGERGQRERGQGRGQREVTGERVRDTRIPRCPRRSVLVPSKFSITAMIFVVMLSFYYFSRHVSA